MRAAAVALLRSGLTQAQDEALKLIDLGGATHTKNPTTLEMETTYPNRAEAWTGVGSLQPNLRDAPATAPDGAGGVREVAVSYRASLPASVPVTPGLLIEDASGRLYSQVTEPVQPSGMQGQWLLNLGPPT
jgi:hypothetical protein